MEGSGLIVIASPFILISPGRKRSLSNANERGYQSLSGWPYPPFLDHQVPPNGAEGFCITPPDPGEAEQQILNEGFVDPAIYQGARILWRETDRSPERVSFGTRSLSVHHPSRKHGREPGSE